MARLTRDEYFREAAMLQAQRSTCSRLNVGALIVRDYRIISQGYNGTPSGLPHCAHECNCGSYPVHLTTCASGPCSWAVHAESNAIAWAARQGISTEGSELWVTHLPCLDCAKLIINAGIQAVNYGQDYRSYDGSTMLYQANIPLFRWTA